MASQTEGKQSDESKKFKIQNWFYYEGLDDAYNNENNKKVPSSLSSETTSNLDPSKPKFRCCIQKFYRLYQNVWHILFLLTRYYIGPLFYFVYFNQFLIQTFYLNIL